MEATNTPISGADIAIFLNRNSGNGSSTRHWNRFIRSPVAENMSLSKSDIFEPLASSGNLLDQVDKWVTDRTKQGITKFIAAGGDGTVNTLINSLLKQPKTVIDSVMIGAIALGSSNDFHKGNAEKRSYKGISYRLNFENCEKHDIVSTDLDQSFVKFFVINASLGITAEANQTFSNSSRLTSLSQVTSTQMSIMVAAMSAFIRHRSLAINIEYEGGPKPVTSTPINNIGLIKNRHFAGSFKYGESQAVNSGKMGIFICSGMNKLQILVTMVKLLAGKFPLSRNTRMFETSKLKMTSKLPFVIELDGETFVTSSASLQVLPRKLSICP